MTLDSLLLPPNDEEEMILFTIIGIEYLLNHSPTPKQFERIILERRLLRYLERLGELYLDEPEKKR